MLAPPDITGLLDDWGRGDSRALDRLVPLVYAELRRVAARQLRLERDWRTARAWLVRELGAEAHS